MFKANWADIANFIAYIIAAASIIVKITPTQKDDAILGKVVKFLGKYIALNKTLQDVYTKNNGDMSNIDVITAKRNRDDYLA